MFPLLIIHATAGGESRAQVEACLAHFRKHHPAMPGLFISDGPEPWHAPVAEAFRLEYHEGVHSKTIRFGSFWLSRMLLLGFECAARHRCDVLWKIDPDTLVQRPFRGEPPPADCFGHIHNERAPHVQGGSVFISVSAAAKIFEAASDCARFTSHDLWLPTGVHPGIQSWARSSGWVSGDFITSFLVTELGLTAAEWDEIYSVCGATPFSPEAHRYAVIHPRRKIEPPNEASVTDTPMACQNDVAAEDEPAA
jgi:hypothetical protein